MAKFDTYESLPDLFKSNKLNINAVSNGSYIIFKDPQHRSFIKLPDYRKISPIKFKPELDFNLNTLRFNLTMSESNAIDFAHHSGILSKYSSEKDLKLTTRGRFYSDKFVFQLGEVGDVNVQSVQIEVDSGYEGKNQFLIIEAKSSTRATFNIRQLYYPFRHFQTKTRKAIRTILLSFSNGIYYFTEISLSPDYYTYRILNNTAIEVEIGTDTKPVSLNNLVNQHTYNPTGIPVPQADDINKVIDLITFLSANPSDKFQIANYFEFDERQGDYYANAGCYVRLLEKNGNLFQPTSVGKEIIAITNRHARNIKVVESILSTELFNDLLKLFVTQDNSITDQQIIERIEKEGLTGSTTNRRKSTIKAWMQWILNQFQKEGLQPATI